MNIANSLITGNLLETFSGAEYIVETPSGAIPEGNIAWITTGNDIRWRSPYPVRNLIVYQHSQSLRAAYVPYRDEAVGAYSHFLSSGTFTFGSLGRLEGCMGCALFIDNGILMVHSFYTQTVNVPPEEATIEARERVKMRMLYQRVADYLGGNTPAIDNFNNVSQLCTALLRISRVHGGALVYKALDADINPQLQGSGTVVMGNKAMSLLACAPNSHGLFGSIYVLMRPNGFNGNNAGAMRIAASNWMLGTRGLSLNKGVELHRQPPIQ
ncbi:MAG: hypothetical protein FWC77_07275 [Defluviitaleaceae bacterium]|nr:hypothetical protein [Defluviitaleaceae bacterium]